MQGGLDWDVLSDWPVREATMSAYHSLYCEHSGCSEQYSDKYYCALCGALHFSVHFKMQTIKVQCLAHITTVYTLVYTGIQYTPQHSSKPLDCGMYIHLPPV